MSFTEKESRERLAANSAWYRYVAKHGHRAYCQRNLNASLRYHARQRTRPHSLTGQSSSNPPATLEGANGVPTHEAKKGSPSLASLKKGETINGIARKMAPFDLAVPEPEQVLRIDIKALTPKNNQTSNPSVSLREPPSKRTKLSARRCRCEITIWHVPPNQKTYPVRQTQLLRDSQQCTLTRFVSDGDVSAAIQLDETFFIKGTKLLVPVKTGGCVRYLLGQSYRLQVSLQPIVYNDSRWRDDWPPVPIHSPGSSLSGEPFPVDEECINRLDALMMGFPETPVNGSLYDVYLAKYDLQPKFYTKYGLQVEALWSSSRSTSTRASPPQRLPQSNSASVGTGKSLRDLAHIEYRFPSIDPFTPDSGSRVYKVTGYLCPFCHDRNLKTAKLLQFHLVTNHELFKFHFSGSETQLQANNSESLKIEVFDISKESAYDEFIEADTWRWVKPSGQAFDLFKYLKGDKSWTTGKKSKNSRPEKNPVPKSPGSAQQAADQSLVRDLPKRTKKRFRVPMAPPGGAFFCTASKRALREGELLSESDDEVDESWLKQKHSKVINSFDDLTEPEKQFIQRWDDYIFEEKPLTTKYVGHALLRFTKVNRAWLSNNAMITEFFKHMSKLVLSGTISPQVARTCLSMVQATANGVVSTCPANVGEGTNNYVTGQVSTPVRRSRSGSHKFSATKEHRSTFSDAMDIDNDRNEP